MFTGFINLVSIPFFVFVCVQVAGVVGRAELLSALFFLSSFLVYQKAVASKFQGTLKT